MKIAIISVSENGKKLANNIKAILNEDSTFIKVDLFHKNVKTHISEIFEYNSQHSFFKNYNQKYDAIVGIMATGILIRSVAPFLKSKSDDPAIIGMDDNGKFVISLLSGHLGRANELTKKLAKKINSQPVITTATDINNKVGIDVLANDLFLEILDTTKILPFNKAILEGKSIKLVTQEDNFVYLNDYVLNLNNPLEFDVLDDERISSGIIATLNNMRLLMLPKTMVVGIGSKKGKSKNAVLNAIHSVFNDLNLTSERIDYLATAEVKKDEKGILEASDQLNIPLKIVAMDDLKSFQCNDCSKSEFVKKQFGINGVCEQSAMIIAGKNSKLIYKKTAFNGVTIAVAISN